MEKKKKVLVPIIIGIVAIIAIVVAVVLMNSGKSTTDMKYRVIKVDSFVGEVSLERDLSEEKIFEGMKLKSKDKVTTGDESTLELVADSDKYIMAKENTCFSVINKGNENKGKLTIDLEYGTALIKIENKLNDESEFEVHTPNAITAVRGTTFEVTYDKDNKTTTVTVKKGTVEVSSDKESKMVEAVDTVYVFEDGTIITQSDNTDGNENPGEDNNIEEESDMWPAVPDYSDEVVVQFTAIDIDVTYDIGVKRLNDWELHMESDRCDGFIKDDIYILYYNMSQEDLDYRLDDLLTYYSDRVIVDTIINDDGDEIVVIKYIDFDSGLPYQVSYAKPVGDEAYIFIDIYFGFPERLNNFDVEKFARITCNQYFAIEEHIYENQGKVFDGGMKESDFPQLLRGNATLKQLNFFISVIQYCKWVGNESYTKTALGEIYYLQTDDDYFVPISSSGGSSTYDINELNNLFSVMTDEKIDSSNISQYSVINGNELTYQACDVSRGSFVYVTIKDCTKHEDGIIVIDYSYDLPYGSDGTRGIKGTSKAYLTPDADGKYKIDSIEVLSEEEYDY